MRFAADRYTRNQRGGDKQGRETQECVHCQKTDATVLRVDRRGELIFHHAGKT